jgi:uracil-DNA glycosylase
MQELRRMLQMVKPYPKGMMPIPRPISGTAFFPGGTGLWQTESSRSRATSHRQVMILGHDFDSEAAYNRSFKRGDETSGPTWRNLLSLLRDVGISPTECFFTNYFMGMRRGSISTGPSPASADLEFIERCGAFFIEQLKFIRPKLLLTLGTVVPRTIAFRSGDLNDWQTAKQFADLDRLGPVRLGVRFEGYRGRMNLVALTHPSIRGPNVLRRRFRSHRGHKAELAMLKEAIRA